MQMATATLNGTVIANSDETVIVEGNHYFPPASVRFGHFSEAAKTSVCHWKGTANYYDVSVPGADATVTAWVYREPKDAAANIKDHVAFWGQVVVVD